MSFCSKCGKELPSEAKFCFSCGSPINNNALVPTNTHERTYSYEGEIYKCPNCGDVLDAFEIKCETCGWERRTAQNSTSIYNLTLRLSEIESKQLPVEQEKRSVFRMIFGNDFRKKINEQAKADFESKKEKEKAILISTFPIHNTKEDILEFLQLAASQIIGRKKLQDEVSNAWIIKFKQCDQKAKLMLDEDKEYLKFQELNAEVYDKLKITRGGKRSWRSWLGF